LAAALAALVASTAQASHSSAAAKGPKPASAAAWRSIVAKAKQEGSLTVYTIQSPVTVAAAAAAFKEKYGISVTVNRNVDAVLLPQVNAEEKTGKGIADVWVTTSKGIVLGALNNKWVSDAVGPSLFAKGFDRKTWLLGKAFIQGSNVPGMVWNTKLVSQRVNDMPDLLTPAFANGKLGVIDPSISTSAMAWYLWLQRVYGANVLQKLAAQKPKIYLSSLTITQAVISGEIAGGTFGVGTALDDKAKGAPVDFKLPNNGKVWNSSYFTMILKQAPHPNAAQLWANFVMSRGGQAIVNRRFGAIYPNIPDTFYAKPEKQILNDYTPKKVAAFQAKWDALFKK